MSTKIKICGLKEPETLETTIQAGADFVGFVFFPKSPRNVDLQEAATLVSQIENRTASVALTVNASDDQIESINTTVNPDWFQLHGSETLERVIEVKKLTQKPVIKAFGVATQADIDQAMPYKEAVDFMLFDAKPPPDGKSLPGGNGLSFDWTLMKNVEKQMQYMLSGGLNPENVQSAIELTGASAVDVSSGVESAPGIKDPQKIRAFIEAARSSEMSVRT